MKVLLHYPNWGNRWAPYFKEELEKAYDLTVSNTGDGEELGDLSTKADVLISMWASEATIFWSNYFADKKIITYLRRYEMWTKNLMTNIKWDAVDAVVFVTEYYRNMLKRMWANDISEEKLFVIPNGVDISDFPWKSGRSNTKKIAMVCSIRNVKNIPLACQILLELPDEYVIYHIGIPANDQIEGQILSYIGYMGLNNRFIMDGHIGSSKVSDWLEDKEYILSTSINEGNPNNVIEGMAMGIQPVIHAWPGAYEQFPKDCVFKTVSEAVKMITNSPQHEPAYYRRYVKEAYSVNNFGRIHDVINYVTSQENK